MVLLVVLVWENVINGTHSHSLVANVQDILNDVPSNSCLDEGKD